MSQPTLWDARKAAALAQEQDLPVKVELRRLVAEYGPRLQIAFGKLDQLWPTYDWSTAGKAEAALKGMTRGFIDAIANLNRPLPTTSICICPGCRRVTLPGASGSFACGCGRMWHFHRDSRFKPMPFGFWTKFLPGDVTPKRLLSEEQAEDGGHAA